MGTGNTLINIGIISISIGLIFNYAPWLINWFGKLPLDIQIENENSSVFIPITSMLVISIVLTIIINVFFRK